MSYQYPAHFLPLGSDMEVPHSGFAPNYGASGSGQASMDQGTHEPTDQERRDSILQASRRKSKRSMNKPNVKLRQANISDSSQSGQAGDKKRNKLGYHRTSVACGRWSCPVPPRLFRGCTDNSNDKDTAAGGKFGA